MPELTDQFPSSKAAALSTGGHGIACLVAWAKVHRASFAVEPDVRSIDEALARGSHLAGTIACLDASVDRARAIDGAVQFTMRSSDGRTSAGWLVEDQPPRRGSEVRVCGVVVGRYVVAPERTGVFLIGRMLGAAEPDSDPATAPGPNGDGRRRSLGGDR